MIDLPDHVELAPGLLVLRPRPRGPWDSEFRSAYTMFKQLVRRRRVIDLLGGKCRRCGYVGHVGSYHVHHTQPHLKHRQPKGGSTRFTASGTSRPYLTESELDELRTCELLCANCHHTEPVGSRNAYIKYVNVNTGAYGAWEEVAWTS